MRSGRSNRGINRQKFVYFVLWLLIVDLCPVVAQKEMEIRGVKKTNDVFIQNPYDLGKNQFCIRKIYLNQHIVNENPQVSALAVSLETLDNYAPFTLRIVHRTHCQPLLLNHKDIEDKHSFSFVYIAFVEATLEWHVQDEKEAGVYLVEQYCDGIWTTQEEIPSSGRKTQATYTYTPTKFLRGNNVFRVMYKNARERFLSPTADYYYAPEPILFWPKVVKDSLTLSKRTYFEIINEDDEVLLKGTAKKIPLRRLPAGEYYIVLDGDTLPFVKR